MTRTRAIQILVLAIALALGYWIISHTRWQTVWQLAPLGSEAAKDPYYGAKRLARLLGGQAETLPAMDTLPRTNETLLVTAPWWGLFREQDVRIRHWVENGGHLAIDANLIEEDAWTWIGVEVKPVARDEDEDAEDDEDVPAERAQAQEPDALSERPSQRFPDLSRCPELWEVDARGIHGRHFGSCWPRTSILTTQGEPLWQLLAEEGPQALRMPAGHGRVTVFLPRYFEARAMLQEDSALYFALVTDLRPGARLWLYPHAADASLLTLIGQQAGAAVLMLAITVAFALWRAIPRFGPLVAASTSTRRALSEQIIGSGEFIHRSGQGSLLLQAQRRALDSAARARLRAYDALTANERASAIAKFCGLDAAAVHRAQHAMPSREVPLESLLHVLEIARRHLRIPINASPTPTKASP
ncbi:MAG: DUF4350 domain-containing protein [Betaproteobacteria bacterium]|nr:DUF4350 domain-containing protein [Betaproteobacteria bacterium]